MDWNADYSSPPLRPGMTTLETILPYALRVSQAPADSNAVSNFIVRLQLVTDFAVLENLASRFALTPEVACHIWRRAAALKSDDPAVLTQVAGAFYGIGVDEEAIKLVDAALGLDERFIPAWEMKAALCPDKGERRKVLERILEIDPGNRLAVDSLIMMGRPNK